jgi:hypothetical protein
MNREQRGLPVGTARIMRRWNTPVNRLYENSSREHTIPDRVAMRSRSSDYG